MMFSVAFAFQEVIHVNGFKNSLLQQVCLCVCVSVCVSLCVYVCVFTHTCNVYMVYIHGISIYDNMVCLCVAFEHATASNKK